MNMDEQHNLTVMKCISSSGLLMFYLAKADPKTDAEISCSLTSELFRICRINWKPPVEHRV